MKTHTLPVLILLTFVAALTLWAADVWVAKPYTDWTTKDIQKIMSDSPFAKSVTVIFENGGRGGIAAGSGKGGGRTSGPQGESADPGTDGGAGGGIAESSSAGGRGGGGGGGRGGGGGGGGGGAGGGGGGAPETELTIRWETALVVQQAVVKAQYGAEAATNPEAQKKLQPREDYYLIWVTGLPAGVRPRDDDAKKSLLAATTLSAKDKDAIVAAEVIFPAPAAGGGRGAARTEAHFVFPRKIAFSADDKEVEFATKFGKNTVKTKFVLKSMVVNGKLGL